MNSSTQASSSRDADSSGIADDFVVVDERAPAITCMTSLCVGFEPSQDNLIVVTGDVAGNVIAWSADGKKQQLIAKMEQQKISHDIHQRKSTVTSGEGISIDLYENVNQKTKKPCITAIAALPYYYGVGVVVADTLGDIVVFQNLGGISRWHQRKIFHDHTRGIPHVLAIDSFYGIIFVGCSNGMVYSYPLRAMEIGAFLPAHSECVTAMQVISCGKERDSAARILVTAGQSLTLKGWHIKGIYNISQELFDIGGKSGVVNIMGSFHGGYVTAIASMKESIILTAGSDAVVKVWHVDPRGETSSCVLTLPRVHQVPIKKIECRRLDVVNEYVVVTIDESDVVVLSRLWDVGVISQCDVRHSGHCILRKQTPQVAWLDGLRLACATYGGTIECIDIKEELKKLCA